MMRICSTHMRTHINKRALADAHASFAFRNCCTQKKLCKCEAFGAIGRHLSDFRENGLHTLKHQVKSKILLTNAPQK